MHWEYGMGGGWMMLFWILLATAAIALVVWAIARAASQSSPAAGTPPARAEEILRERYARGEITREQFDQMLGDLRR
jgi:putative membrane protein